jgi:fibronectin type 3 domain-containing protein
MFLILFLGTVLNLYTNDVVVKRADTVITPTIGMELKDIDTVIVKDSSKAEILYPDSTVLYLDENTSINTSGEKKRTVFMSFGRIWAKVKKLVKGESLEITTPVSVSGITGTEFEQTFRADKLECKVVQGELNFKDKKTGKETLLEDGKMALIEEGREAKIQKFRKDQLSDWYKWKTKDIDFLLKKLEKAASLGDAAKTTSLTTQVQALAGKLGVLDDYEKKLDKVGEDLLKSKDIFKFKGGFAPTEKGFLYAISGDVKAGKTFILLTWPHKEGVKAYNIYRTEVPSSSVPTTPINSKPISIMTDCGDIKAVIPEGSEEWQAIANILSKPARGKTGKTKGSSSKGSKGTSILDIAKTSPTDMFVVSSDRIYTSPCNISSIPDTSKAYMDLQALASRYWKVGVVIGQAYVDDKVTVGKKYLYAISEAKRTGTSMMESKFIDTASVVAGTVLPLPAPSGVTTQAGDNKVLIRWNEIGTASGYDVYRSSLSASPVKINGAGIMEKCTLDLEENKIPAKNCFIDFMRWDEAGYPVKHEVVTPDSIYGPYNGTNYKYKVRAYDVLGRPGMFSSEIPALPQDKTPPAVPYGITVDAYPDGLQPKWYQVTLDALGHVELSGIKGYKVYRFNSADSLADSIIVKSLLPDTFGTFPFFKDKDPALFSAYGEKEYWYRVRCIDNKNNVSAISPAAGNHLPDTTPPKRPRNLKATSHADHIALSWEKPSPVPSDLAGYNIYRGVCGGDTVCVDSARIGEQKQWVCTKREYRPYPVYLVGNKDYPDSLKYNDYTVPPGSPICYRYSIKAYDKSQNLSDTSKTVCQKLREETPPAPPIIAGLKARDGAIKVEWVSSPVQDLFGFVVERADKEAGPYKRVSDTLIFPAVVKCEDIPATNIWAADSVFSFVDTTVQEKKVYWYRVRAADYGGNIGDPSVPIETYTYDLGEPPTPFNLSVSQPPGKCALEISWRPAYDSKYAGFVVFRSSDAFSGYRQISPIVRGNMFLDDKIIANKEYWYRVQHFAKNGNRSRVSGGEKGKATP